MSFSEILLSLVLNSYLDLIRDNHQEIKNYNKEQLYSLCLYKLLGRKFRIQITGARDYTNEKTVKNALKEYIPEYCIVVHGNCSGADKLCGKIAKKKGFEVEEFPAEWSKYGRAAGPVRNIQMLNIIINYVFNPDVVLVFHPCLEKSKGTKHCANEANKRGLNIKYFI